MRDASSKEERGKRLWEDGINSRVVSDTALFRSSRVLASHLNLHVACGGTGSKHTIDWVIAIHSFMYPRFTVRCMKSLTGMLQLCLCLSLSRETYPKHSVGLSFLRAAVGVTIITHLLSAGDLMTRAVETLWWHTEVSWLNAAPSSVFLSQSSTG
jgi:hypothetical protein